MTKSLKSDYLKVYKQINTGSFIGKRGINRSHDPEIPLPENFKTAEYLDSLLKKGVRYRKLMHLMVMLITRTIETGGITILKNDVVKKSFKHLYGIDVSEKQIFNLLKKLQSDKQIHIKVQTTRLFDKSGKPIFKKKRFIYVWASYYYNNCKIEEKLSRYGNVSTLPEKTAKLPIKYKIKKTIDVLNPKTKKMVKIAPFMANPKDAVLNGLLPKWFRYGLDEGVNPNNRKTLVWGFDDIKAFRDQNILEFLSYMGHSPEARLKQRKKELIKTLKGNSRRKYELISNQ